MKTVDSQEGIKWVMEYNGSFTIDASDIEQEVERQREDMRKLFRQKRFGEICNIFLKHLFGSIENFAVRVSCKRKFEIFGERTLAANFEHRNFLPDSFTSLKQFWDSHVLYYPREFPMIAPLLPAMKYLNVSPEIVAKDCQEVTIGLLLQFKRTTAFLINTNLNGNDFHLVIRSWLMGRHPNLNALILWQETPYTIDPVTVLGMLEIHPFDEQQRARHYFLAPEIGKYTNYQELLLNCKYGFDILREDGKRCTVRICRETVFCFYVWHQNFQSA
uniref:FBA_2 domain-containing protein n=2 Tax=Caenorhabditis tropicalis TaxID=1561998 RepID=A0A1I7URQ1_9PELO